MESRGGKRFASDHLRCNSGRGIMPMRYVATWNSSLQIYVIFKSVLITVEYFHQILVVCTYPGFLELVKQLPFMK